MSALQNANLETLVYARFECDHLATEALDTLLLRKHSDTEIAKLLRPHGEKAFQENELDLRSGTDRLLSLYSLIEIGSYARALPREIPASIRSLALDVLTLKPVKLYYETYYPRELVRRFRNRLNGEQDFVGERYAEEASALYRTFIDVDRQIANDEDVQTLQWMLDDARWGDVGLPDLFDACQDPAAFAAALGGSKDVPGRVAMGARGLTEYIEFGVRLDSLLERASRVDELGERFWLYYEYWFRQIGRRLEEALDRVLTAFGAWSLEGDRSPNVSQLQLAFARLLLGPEAYRARTLDTLPRTKRSAPLRITLTFNSPAEAAEFSVDLATLPRSGPGYRVLLPAPAFAYPSNTFAFAVSLSDGVATDAISAAEQVIRVALAVWGARPGAPKTPEIDVNDVRVVTGGLHQALTAALGARAAEPRYQRAAEMPERVFLSSSGGRYQTAAMAYSVDFERASLAAIEDALDAPTLAENAAAWASLSGDEKQVFLVTRHEAAHHRLLYSTPAGALLWRMDQVISRDVYYLAALARRTGLYDGSKSLRDLFLTEPRSATVRAQDDAEYAAQTVISALDAMNRLRGVLFGPMPGVHHTALTFGELADLMNYCFRYMSRRCDVAWNGHWVCDEPAARVFPEQASPNVRDVVEVDAIAHEMWLARTFADPASQEQLARDAGAGPYRKMFREVVEVAGTLGTAEPSPYHMQVVTHTSCSGALDVSVWSTGRLEKQLPWLRVARWRDDPKAILLESVDTLQRAAMAPLVGPESEWLKYSIVPIPTPRLLPTMSTISSLGLDLQMWTMKQGFGDTLELIGSAVVTDRALAERAYNKWLKGAETRLSMKEFRDAITLGQIDMAAVLGPRHPLRDVQGCSPLLLVLGNLALAVATEAAFASYEGRLFWNLDALARKVADAVVRVGPGSSDLADVIRRFILSLPDVGGSPFGGDELDADPGERGF